MAKSQGEKAFEDGKRVALRNRPSSSNPYVDKDPLFHRWRDGWQAGNSDAYFSRL